MFALSADQVLTLFISIICATLVSLTTTPLVRIFAYKIGAIDIPKDARRMHKTPMPLLGGLAIFAGFVVSVLAFCEISRMLVGMLLGIVIIVFTGVIDDRFNIRPLVKMGMQIVAGIVAFASGTRIDHIRLFDTYIHFGKFSIIVTIIWIVALTNAVNLIDGLDGLSCGVSTISSVAILISSFFLPDTSYTIILLTGILAGSCAGFLPFNLNPAKIFMGDTGAMFLGYVLSLIAIQGFFKVSAVVSFAVPFMVFALPLADTFFAFCRRILHGKSPFSADRGHIHHRLIDMGFNQKQSVMMLYAISALMGLSAVLFAMGRTTGGMVMFGVSFTIFITNWFLVTRDVEARTKMGYIKNLPQSSIHDEDESESDN